ncbi:MAG: D-2-hydroxyacid dehydrogenase [Alphaproteobacteria bacterium]|nr:D-2-hydroxyacid dehydrogenase [Alphaproteobacteria bacterium]
MAKTSFRVHVQNPLESDATNLEFAITNEIWSAAASRRPDLVRDVQLSIGWSSADFDRMMGDAEILISWTGTIKAHFDRRDRPAMPNLKWLFATSAGLDRLAPFDWLPAGARLCNNSGTHTVKAGEYGMMALLMINATMPQFMVQQRECRYEKIFSTVIAGKTVLIVGLGHIGGAIAARARQFGMRVIGIRANPQPHSACDHVFGIDALDQMLPEADFVLLSLPLTAQTRGLMNRAGLDRMKSTAGLINMARGPVLDEDALCDKLDRGEIQGAVLDVYGQEPVPAESRLWTTRNLIMTPHVSSDDLSAYIPRSLDIFFDNLAAWRQGLPLPNAIDPKRGY